jgi:hypothetical protein
MSVVQERRLSVRKVGRAPATSPVRFLLFLGACLAAWAVALYSRGELAAPSFVWVLTLLGAIAVLDLAAPVWLLLGWRRLRAHSRSSDGRVGLISRLRRPPDGWVRRLLGMAALAAASYGGVTLAVRFQSFLEPLAFPSLGAIWPFGLALASVTVVITGASSLVLVWRLLQRSIAGSPTDRALQRLWVAALGTSAGVAAIVLLTVASSVLIQDAAANETSHYALIRALADGTPIIDRYQRETIDVAYYAGHFYSNKAPGLAFLSLPLYETLEVTGALSAIESASGRDAVIRTLSLWAVALPGGVLLLLVRHFANRVAPGFGTAAAVTLGLGTLFLPYSTMFYSHVLAASLAFGAFALLWHERDRAPSAAVVAAGGLLAGLAVTTEYALALAGLVLGVYAISRGTNWLRRGLAYSAGVVLGVLPLLLYNWWAFGSPTHLSYADAVAVPGRTGHDVTGLHDVGFFGVSPPDLSVTVELLFSPKGLLVCAPVLVAGVAGIGSLYKRGWRAEALVVGSIALLFLAYNSGWNFDPFGGNAPGPRFLVAILPFAAVPLAVAYEKFTAVTLGLAVASATLMVIATATGPDAIGGDSDPGVWLNLVSSGTFQETVVSQAGVGTGWAGILPFAMLVASALVFAARATDWSRLSSGLRSGIAALVAWGVIALLAQAGNPGDVPRAWGFVGLCLATALVALPTAVWASARRRAT